MQSTIDCGFPVGNENICAGDSSSSEDGEEAGDEMEEEAEVRVDGEEEREMEVRVRGEEEEGREHGLEEEVVVETEEDREKRKEEERQERQRVRAEADQGLAALLRTGGPGAGVVNVAQAARFVAEAQGREDEERERREKAEGEVSALQSRVVELEEALKRMAGHRQDFQEAETEVKRVQESVKEATEQLQTLRDKEKKLKEERKNVAKMMDDEAAADRAAALAKEAQGAALLVSIHQRLQHLALTIDMALHRDDLLSRLRPLLVSVSTPYQYTSFPENVLVRFPL